MFCRDLAKAIRENTTLQELHLNCNKIGDEGCDALATAVEHRKRGKLRICAQGNLCSTEALNRIEGAIDRHRCRGRDGTFDLLSSGEEEAQLQDVQDSNYREIVDSDDDAQLIPSEGHGKKVEVVDLTVEQPAELIPCERGKKDRCESEKEEDWEESAAESRVSKKMLRIMRKLNDAKRNELDLRDCSLCLADLHSIFSKLRKCGNITKLDLNTNLQLGDAGLQDLVSTLLASGLTQLKWLDLAKTNLTSAAVPILFQGLEVTTTINYVDLRDNNFNTKDWETIKLRYVSSTPFPRRSRQLAQRFKYAPGILIYFPELWW
jgi:hypothetical protein